MKDIYKKLMEQHGGSIPFTILGGVKKNKTIRRKNSKRRHKSKRRRKTKRSSFELNTDKYSIGTIIRKKGQLWRLTQSRKWIQI